VPLSFTSVADYGLAPAAEVFTQGFAGYYVPIAATPASLLGMVRQDSVDLTLSRIALQDGAPVAAALVARRGWTCRLAGMAVLPGVRRQGFGRALMAQLLAEARARGDRAMELEVIEQNEAAVALYQGLGFLPMRRLTGHAGRPPTDPTAAQPLEEIDVREFARLVAVHGFPDLPWQISAATLVHLGPPFQALRFGPSSVLISDPAISPISIRGIITEAGARGRGHALALLRAIFVRYPDRDWRVGAIFPEDIAAIFAHAGLSVTSISQWQMTKPLR